MKIILFAIPGFLVLILTEWLYGLGPSPQHKAGNRLNNPRAKPLYRASQAFTGHGAKDSQSLSIIMWR